MKLRHFAAGLAGAAVLPLGAAGPAAAGGTPAFTCYAAQDNVYLYGDGPGQGPVDWILHTGRAFYGHYTRAFSGVFWSYGHTAGNPSRRTPCPPASLRPRAFASAGERRRPRRAVTSSVGSRGDGAGMSTTGQHGSATWRELYAAAAPRLAEELIPLLAEPQEWIQRRVEMMTVVSTRLVRRSVSVDMVLPDSARRERLRLDPADDETPLVIPLGVLRKAQLIDFDLREGSRPLLFVRSRLNVLVAAAVIAEEAQSDAISAEDAEAARPWLVRIAGPAHEDARKAFDELFPTEGREPSNALPAGARRFARSRNARAIALQLRDAYILLVELPDSSTRRRLVGFATDQQLVEPVEPRAGSSPLARSLGLSPTEIDLDVPGIAQTASYHVEVEVPRGCSAATASLECDGESVGRSVEIMGSRASIYGSRATETAEIVHGDVRLRVGVRQDGRYFLFPALFAALVSTALLLAGLCVLKADGSLEPAATAILLSFIGLVTGLVVKSDEEKLTAELHGGARMVLVVVALCSVTAAAATAFGAQRETLERWWTWCALISVLGAGILALSVFVRRDD